MLLTTVREEEEKLSVRTCAKLHKSSEKQHFRLVLLTRIFWISDEETTTFSASFTIKLSQEGASIENADSRIFVIESSPKVLADSHKNFG